MVTANLKIIFGRLVRNNICQGDSFLTICGIKHFKLDEHHIHAGYNCTFIKSVLHFSTLHMVASYWEIYLCSIESIVNNSWTIGWDHCVQLETILWRFVDGILEELKEYCEKLWRPQCGALQRLHNVWSWAFWTWSTVEVVSRAVSDDGGHEISVLTFHTRHTLTCASTPHNST